MGTQVLGPHSPHFQLKNHPGVEAKRILEEDEGDGLLWKEDVGHLGVSQLCSVALADQTRPCCLAPLGGGTGSKGFEALTGNFRQENECWD